MFSFSRHWDDLRYSISVQPMPHTHVFADDLVSTPFGPMKVISIDRVDASQPRLANPSGSDSAFPDVAGVIAEVMRRNYFASDASTAETRGDFMYHGVLLEWKLAREHPVKATFNGNDIRKQLITKIFCNDCEKESLTAFHFLGRLYIQSFYIIPFTLNFQFRS